jgi:hypothetical protein
MPALAAGALLRAWMLREFPQFEGDSLIYGGLAKNLLLHGRYATADGSGALHETLFRLPGYPLFLALCFRLFGMENYNAAAYAQIGMELLGCVLLADFVRRIAPPGAALATLWLAALCPFTASYAAAPLTETPTLFAIALALWAVGRFHARPGWSSALWFTLAASFAALLRPEGALVGVALAPALVVGLRRETPEQNASGAEQAAEKGGMLGEKSEKHPSGPKGHIDSVGIMRGLNPPPPSGSSFSAACKAHANSAGFMHGLKPVPSTKLTRVALARMAAVCVLLALLPFAAWTARNWRVFHVIEPLAPRYANDPGETTYPGWQHWMKTWCLDFISTSDFYWNVPGGPFDVNKLPGRAFDSPAQYAETAALAAEYNAKGQDMPPEMDARFERLAEERVQAHPLRYYLWLPLGRVGDMWLRPRVENLPIDLDWWVYENHDNETLFSWGYAGLNALYLLLGLAGLCMRPRFWPSMLAYLVLRSALLATIEAPETRYTLECFPMLFVLGGVAVYGGLRKMARLHGF